MSYLCYLCLSLTPGVCRRDHVFLCYLCSSLPPEQEVKTNTNNINKTEALLQTTGGKDEHK
jgi:hypothetical protein